MRLLIICGMILVASVSICLASVDNIENMKKIADNGNSYAQFEVGKWYYEHGNKEFALNYLSASCEGGYTPACGFIETNNLYGYSSYTNKLDGEAYLDKGIMLYKEKKYRLSFPIFKKLCDNGDRISCLYLGRSYALGLGTTENTSKAMEIFQKYRDFHDVFKFEEAALLEYRLAERDDDLNKVMSIYNELQNSTTDWIAKEAKAGLNRIPVYNFLNEYIPVQGGYFRKNIDYDRFYREMHRLDTRYLPSEMAHKFFAMRDVCLQAAKNDDNFWWEMGKNAASSFVNTFATGIFGLIGSVKEGYDIRSKMDETAKECNRRYSTFIDEMGKNDVSAKWFNAKVRMYYPQ